MQNDFLYHTGEFQVNDRRAMVRRTSGVMLFAYLSHINRSVRPTLRKYSDVTPTITSSAALEVPRHKVTVSTRVFSRLSCHTK